MKYWINTVSRNHVLVGEKNKIVQANHGKEKPLKRLSVGDIVLYYSPKTDYENGESLKKFTAIARISNDQVYQFKINDDFMPFRIDATYEDCSEVSIEPLIEKLTFIKNKKSWGYMFRFGLFEINEHDFKMIYESMKS
jgi:hypothetical protein